MLRNATPHKIMEDLRQAWRSYDDLEQQLVHHLVSTRHAKAPVRQAETRMQLQMDRIQDLLETGERIMNERHT